jgi:HNH endonuclease
LTRLDLARYDARDCGHCRTTFEPYVAGDLVFCSRACRWQKYLIDWRQLLEQSWAEGHMRWADVRAYVLARDGCTCSICRLPIRLERRVVDHIEARANGGFDHWDNLRVAHRFCNACRGPERLSDSEIASRHLWRLCDETVGLRPVRCLLDMPEGFRP